MEATVDLIGYKIADKITKILKTLQQNNSESVTNEHGKERDIYLKKEKKTENYWWSKINIIT